MKDDLCDVERKKTESGDLWTVLTRDVRIKTKILIPLIPDHCAKKKSVLKSKY